MGQNEVRHVAIIMDGNRRWALEKGLNTLDGHKAGADAVRKVVEACQELNIKYLTLYAFSTENWKRPLEEIEGLMFLLGRYIDLNIKKIDKEGIRLRAIGKIDEIPEKTRLKLTNAIEKTKNNKNGTLTLAISYGGRSEIIDATKKIVKDCLDTKINVSDINESLFQKYLYAPDIPDPDIIIRTSGETRISNFLLWQLSYSELYFCDKYWPDFDKKDLEDCVRWFKTRERRFGLRNA